MQESLPGAQNREREDGAPPDWEQGLAATPAPFKGRSTEPGIESSHCFVAAAHAGEATLYKPGRIALERMKR